MNFRQPFRGEWPISQRYGEKITDPKGHTGIDYACPVSTPILASADGTVMFAGWDATGFGRCVIIRHDGSHSTLYAHLALIPQGITAGVDVKQGEEVGFSGSTGNSTGPHLHFEARKQWNDCKSHFDPMDLPLMSFADAADPAAKPAETLRGAQAFAEGDVLTVTAPLGAKGFFSEAFDYFTPYPQGSAFYYTGQTAKHNGFTYMKVIPMLRPVWIAVHDNDTQILDK